MSGDVIGTPYQREKKKVTSRWDGVVFCKRTGGGVLLATQAGAAEGGGLHFGGRYLGLGGRRGGCQGVGR